MNTEVAGAATQAVLPEPILRHRHHPLVTVLRITLTTVPFLVAEADTIKIVEVHFGVDLRRVVEGAIIIAAALLAEAEEAEAVRVDLPADPHRV